MPRPRHILPPRMMPVIALLLVGGCVPPEFVRTCPGDGTCTGSFTFVVDQVTLDSQSIIATDRGCIDLGSDCLPTGLVLCGFTHHGLYDVAIRCGDCVITEWPDAWTLLGATWSAPAVPASGAVLVTPAAGYALPPGVGPIVTDPGMSAHVLRLDTDALATPATVTASFRFRNPGGAGACLKALEVALISFSPGGGQVLDPTEGLGTNFAALSPPDPHVLCLAADSTTATRRASWGSLHTIYRPGR